MEIFHTLFRTYPALKGCAEAVFAAYDLLVRCYDADGMVMICGNGGSAADSEHIVGELMKGFNLPRQLDGEEKKRFAEIEDGEYIAAGLQKGLRAVSLVSQTGLMTALANDNAADLVFAQQVYAYSRNKNDVLIALSTSGNSKNVLQAARTAKAVGCRVLAITGESGGKLAKESDICIRLPAHTPFEVQELTLPVYHALCAAVEEKYFG